MGEHIMLSELKKTGVTIETFIPDNVTLTVEQYVQVNWLEEHFKKLYSSPERFKELQNIIETTNNVGVFYWCLQAKTLHYNKLILYMVLENVHIDNTLMLFILEEIAKTSGRKIAYAKVVYKLLQNPTVTSTETMFNNVLNRIHETLIYDVELNGKTWAETLNILPINIFMRFVESLPHIVANTEETGNFFHNMTQIVNVIKKREKDVQKHFEELNNNDPRKILAKLPFSWVLEYYHLNRETYQLS